MLPKKLYLGNACVCERQSISITLCEKLIQNEPRSPKNKIHPQVMFRVKIVLLILESSLLHAVLRRCLFKCSVILSWAATAGGRIGFLSSVWQAWLLKLCETTGPRIIWPKGPSAVFLFSLLLFLMARYSGFLQFGIWIQKFEKERLSWKNK